MSYSGKRVHAKARISSHSRREANNTLLRVLFFPLTIFYLELVLHVSMGMKLSYLPIILVFSAAAGFACTALTLPFQRAGNRVLTVSFTALVSLIYVVEMIAKKILQSYYPFSTLGTAADN